MNIENYKDTSIIFNEFEAEIYIVLSVQSVCQVLFIVR